MFEASNKVHVQRRFLVQERQCPSKSQGPKFQKVIQRNASQKNNHANKIEQGNNDGAACS